MRSNFPVIPIVSITMAGAALVFTGVAPADEPSTSREGASNEKLPPLKLEIDRSKVDLEAHRLEVKMSRKAGYVEVKVFAESGDLLATEQQDFSGRPAGSVLSITWSPSSDAPVARIDVFGHDAFGYYAGVRIVPWSLWIPHEDVNFETNSAAIRQSEDSKLTASLKKIREALAAHKDLGAITLYVAGHTDSVGTAQHNLELSRRRAQSIGSWFRGHGLGIPIAFEGFGESALLVKTADEVDEPKNRRADYVLSVDEPRFKNSDRTPAWKRL